MNLHLLKGIYLDDFFSIVSKHEEHNKCPFLIQHVIVDLSISLRQIKHLNMGVTIPPMLFFNLIINTFIVSSFNYLISKNYLANFSFNSKTKKDLHIAGLLMCVRFLN